MQESALVFSSCYVANDALLGVLPHMMPDLHIFSDAGARSPRLAARLPWARSTHSR